MLLELSRRSIGAAGRQALLRHTARSIVANPIIMAGLVARPDIEVGSVQVAGWRLQLRCHDANPSIRLQSV
jgi:hypothetical protein